MSGKNKQRIVDAHIHWWDLNTTIILADGQQEGDSGLSGAGPIAHTYVAENYLADAAGYDISAVVHIEAQWDPSDSLGETRWLEGLAHAR